MKLFIAGILMVQFAKTMEKRDNMENMAMQKYQKSTERQIKYLSVAEWE